MAVIAVYSVKGGVGKTTLAANLAWCSASQGKHRTLLWDLDVQGAAGYHLRIRPDNRGANKRLLKRRDNIHALVHETDHERLDLTFAQE